MTSSPNGDVLLEQLRPRVARAAARWASSVQVTGIRPLTGGASSLTYIADFEGAPESPVVLKVAPPGLAPVRNRDVLRQARLLTALEQRPTVRVPRVLFEDEGAPPEVPPFLAMNLVAGECVEPVLVELDGRPDPATVQARSYDAMVALAELHAVVPGEIGLADEAVVTPSDEIDRWTRAFETVSTELSGDYLRCAAALKATLPESMPPVINHGDYRLGNTLCEGHSLMAIIDWEIWTVGDPRIDMTWFTFFTDEAAHPASEPGPPAGTPTPAELIAAYEAAIGVSLRDLLWFEALTKYKEAGATALLLKRGLKAGGEMAPSMRRMLPALSKMMDEAMAIVGG